MDTLTPKRAAVLAFLRDRIEGQGLTPSLAEIAAEFGFSSRNAAHKHVQALVAEGLIELAVQRMGHLLALHGVSA